MKGGHEYISYDELHRRNCAFLRTATGSSQSYPMVGIDFPGENDVMLGRGGGTNTHVGNIRFRQLVQEHKGNYRAADKMEKPNVAMLVVQMWRALNPPGRFLAKSDPSDDSYWHDVGDKEARKKASQCLRERTANDLLPTKSLNEKEAERKAKKEQKHEMTDQSNRDSLKKKSVKNVKVHEVNQCRRVSDKNESSADATAVVSPCKGPRRALFKEKNTRNILNTRREVSGRNIRQEIADSLPSAASLVGEVFEAFGEDDVNDDELQGSDTVLSWSPWEFQELMEVPIASGNDAMSFGTDLSGMETLSTSTLLSTFRSMENSRHRTPTSGDTGSMRGIMENQSFDGNHSMSALDLAMPEFQVQPSSSTMDRTACLQKMKLANAQISNFSMLSELTSDSSNAMRGSGRSLQIKNTKGINTRDRGSMQGIMEYQSFDGNDSMSALDPAMPEFQGQPCSSTMDRTACVQKMKLANAQTSNSSMISELTNDSSHARRGSGGSVQIKKTKGISTRDTGSMQGIMEYQSFDGNDSMSALDLAMPEFQAQPSSSTMDRTACVQKMKLSNAQTSNFSMLSELTGEGAVCRFKSRIPGEPAI